LLYHHDCPKCKKVIDELIEKKTKNLVCVEVPPYGDKNGHAKLAETQQWFIEMPCVCKINHSINISISK
jgi:hypothetical protein